MRPSESLGLAAFQSLCAAGNALDALRDTCVPGSDAWAALTDLVRGIDRLIDRLVESPALERED